MTKFMKLQNNPYLVNNLLGNSQECPLNLARSIKKGFYSLQMYSQSCALDVLFSSPKVSKNVIWL